MIGAWVNVPKNFHMDGDGEREGVNKVRRNKKLQENLLYITNV